MGMASETKDISLKKSLDMYEFHYFIYTYYGQRDILNYYNIQE